ncbi:MAG: hypothetical protein M0C28_24840 [Candidatus Moduliflexus flocculans]|nr:hypothetical protein [Candidatus Moduliflexus flocculans]
MTRRSGYFRGWTRRICPADADGFVRSNTPRNGFFQDGDCAGSPVGGR